MLSACPPEQILDCEDEGDGAEESYVDLYDNDFDVFDPVAGGRVAGDDDDDDDDDDFVDDDSVDSLEQEMLNDGVDYGFNDQYNDDGIEYFDNAEYFANLERNRNAQAEDVDDTEDSEDVEDGEDAHD